MLIAMSVAGCQTASTVTTTKTVCKALDGPIKYSSRNPKSDRFAGKALAPDLARRNRTGENLKCW